MAFEGDILQSCPADLDFANTEAVVVSGASWNPCGHMILCTGTNSANSWYFHVAGQGWKELGGVRAIPKFMREDGFRRYLAENSKHEIRRLDAKLKNPAAAYQKLMELMTGNWWWGVLIHNCASFVEEIIKAGGGDLSVKLNCPDQEFVQSLSNQIDEMVKQEAKFQRENIGPKW
ncbi:MAG TPA: hypothetical protein VMT76_01150 [Puia sp.]|nr:hypothetical protein [Puia sp.]